MHKGGGGQGLTSIDSFCYMKTSHTHGLNNSELNFCICLSFSSVAKVQMYRVYYRIIFECLRQHPLTTKLVRGALLAHADKGMITPEDLPHLLFENLLGVLLLCKISRNLGESKPFKTSFEFTFFQIRIDFLKKSSNFN